MQSAASEGASWVQAVVVAAGGLAVFVGTLFGYIKKVKPTSQANDLAIVSAAFADKATLERLIVTMERVERSFCESERRLTDGMRNHCDCLRDAEEATRAQTSATVNLLRFIQPRETPLRGGDHLRPD